MSKREAIATRLMAAILCQHETYQAESGPMYNASQLDEVRGAAKHAVEAADALLEALGQLVPLREVEDLSRDRYLLQCRLESICDVFGIDHDPEKGEDFMSFFNVDTGQVERLPIKEARARLDRHHRDAVELQARNGQLEKDLAQVVAERDEAWELLAANRRRITHSWNAEEVRRIDELTAHLRGEVSGG